MNGKRVSVSFYKTKSGNEPVRRWLQKLDGSQKQVIGADLKTVEYGWPIGMPTCKPIREGIYEVRSNLPGNKIARILFCIYGEHMVLLHGFIKKTQKTPSQDIDLALKRKKQLEARQ